MATGIVRPNANYINQWQLFGGAGAAWERVGENIEQPTAGDDATVQADDDDDNDIEEYQMGTLTGVLTITSITVWVFGTTLTNQPTINVYLGAYLGSKNCTWGLPANWTSYTWSGLSGTQAQLDAMRIKFVSPVHDKVTSCTLDCVYAVITYTEPPSGWEHKFLGLPGASIGKISGLPIAKVGKVKGL